MAFNKVILMGNLVEDPELKYTQSNVPVCSFRIAVSRRFKKEGQPDADFITIVCWRNTAEFVSKYFSKGKGILVCGQIQSRNFTDKDGNKRYVLEVVAEEVSFVERKTDNAPTTESNTFPVAPNYGTVSDFEELVDDADLPF